MMAALLKSKGQAMAWYRDELLDMAKDLGQRLLPAFNTTTGIPFPRVNSNYWGSLCDYQGYIIFPNCSNDFNQKYLVYINIPGIFG